MSTAYDNRSEIETPRVIAVVSGKGGSGKTMISTTIATLLAQSGDKTLLVDADTGTAGLTYYLGIRLIKEPGKGLSNLGEQLMDPNLKTSALERCIQSLQGLDTRAVLGRREGGSAGDITNCDALILGNHRRFERLVHESEQPDVLERVLLACGAIPEYRWIVVDCRGGIDAESLAVCHAADSVLLVVEADLTSIQATGHLVDVLTDRDLAHKILGFVINKAIDDPTSVESHGIATFRAPAIASVPFDVEATRAFLIGALPNRDSIFTVQLQAGLGRIAGHLAPPQRRPLRNAEFDRLTSSRRRSPQLAALLSVVIAAYATVLLTLVVTGVGASRIQITIGIAVIGFLGIVGMSGLPYIRSRRQ